MHDAASPVQSPSAIDRNTPECQELKKKLVAGFHMVARRRMDDGIAGHISCRVPGTHDQFWVNPLGLFFEEVQVEDLFVVDIAGNLLEGNRPYNIAAFQIHATLHKQRHDIVAICHTHPPKGTAFSALGRDLRMIDQTACSFYDDHVRVAEYDGLVFTPEQAAGLAKAVGNKRVAVLQNHGLLTLGVSIEQAVIDMLDLERTCELHLSALAKLDEIVEASPEAAAQVRAVFTNPGRLALQWAGLMRQIERARAH
jgi:ribulose-5-phosphate 4-epimerase/fuculose-1-phosphate aldolase